MTDQDRRLQELAVEISSVYARCLTNAVQAMLAEGESNKASYLEASRRHFDRTKDRLKDLLKEATPYVLARFQGCLRGKVESALAQLWLALQDRPAQAQRHLHAMAYRSAPIDYLAYLAACAHFTDPEESPAALPLVSAAKAGPNGNAGDVAAASEEIERVRDDLRRAAIETGHAAQSPAERREFAVFLMSLAGMKDEAIERFWTPEAKCVETIRSDRSRFLDRLVQQLTTCYPSTLQYLRGHFPKQFTQDAKRGDAR